VKLPSRNRGRTEIIRDILQSTIDESLGARKTKIMYKTFLSYGQASNYLNILINNGLLEHDLVNQRFRITKKGVDFLRLCDQLGNLIELRKKEQERLW
jgi:predicted transcriptional regulator